MTDWGVLAAFLTLALVVPAVLLLIVRFMAWALPPPYNWLVAFVLRHPIIAALVDASIWLLLSVVSFVGPAHWSDWILRAVALLFAADAMWRGVRRAQGRDDFFTEWVKKRYSQTQA